ncbi:MAG: hypothetical protein IKW57_04715, partial [Alphaproteobacteria bacterium]|nr:hypothetical protein [Alphaproteobacteria bacterium]
MRKCGIFSKLNMSILNHGLKTTLRSIFATVIAVMAICGGIETAHAANWMACSSCAKGDYFGGDGYCQIELKDQCGGTLTNCYFDDESGQVSCSGIPSAPACKCSDKGSGWTGSCSGSNYSTCYKSCSVSCLNAGGLDTTACKNSIAYGNGWIDCNDSSNYTV